MCIRDRYHPFCDRQYEIQRHLVWKVPSNFQLIKEGTSRLWFQNRNLLAPSSASWKFEGASCKRRLRNSSFWNFGVRSSDFGILVCNRIIIILFQVLEKVCRPTYVPKKCSVQLRHLLILRLQLSLHSFTIGTYTYAASFLSRFWLVKPQKHFFATSSFRVADSNRKFNLLFQV